jgi:pimeloyl-ACP methyl ester carboxylesterase
MHIEANGITFNCDVDGPEGAPWLAFSNSLATNLTMWDPQASDLKRSFRLLRYDQRGHGGTEAPAGRYTYATLVADALALFDALGIARAHQKNVLDKKPHTVGKGGRDARILITALVPPCPPRRGWWARRGAQPGWRRLGCFAAY